MNVDTKWMSKTELKDYLGFSMGKIENMMKLNQLPYYKIGKNVKFKRKLVEDQLENYLVK
jgi:excisionase family DNA binding protein|tara:strand:- start:258 stop:437 length:180 start_codon:yes stop_codon:yes gene_type:complete